MNERLTLQLNVETVGDAQLNRLSESMNRVSQAGERMATRAMGVGLNQVGDAASAAKEKVQTFVGAIPGMGVAAERFINLIPGLGQVIQKAFPLLGLIAFSEGIGRLGPQIAELAGKFDPLTIAQNRATEAAKEYNAEITKLGENIARTRLEGLAAALGGSASSGLAAGEAQAKQLQAQQNVRLANAAFQRAQEAAKPDFDFVTGEQSNAPGSRAYRAQQLDLDVARKELTKAQLELRVMDDALSKLSVSSARAQQDKNNAAENRAYDMARSVRERWAGVGGGSEFDRIREEAAKFAEPRRRRDGDNVYFDSLSSGQMGELASQTRLKIAAEIARQNADQSKWDVFSGGRNLAGSSISRMGEDYGKEIIANLDRRATAVLEALKQHNAELKQADEANILGLRDEAQHRSRMMALTARPGSEVAALRAELAIQTQTIAAELARKESHPASWLNIEAERAKAVRETQNAQWSFEEKLQELRLRNVNSFRDNVVRSFDDLVGGRGGNVLKSFGLGIQRQVIGNLAEDIYPRIQKLMSGFQVAEGGLMSRLLKGTPFAPDPLKLATDANTAATMANTAALQGAGGGGVGSVAAGVAGLLGVASPGGGSMYQYGAVGADGLPVRGLTSSGAAAMAPKAGSSMMARGIGIAGAAAAGGFAAYDQFRHGDLRGAVGGTGALVGAAGAIMAMTPMADRKSVV